jgi:hypothetical protein
LFICLDCDASYVYSNTVKRNYHKGDYEAIRLELSNTNWEIIDNMSTNESYMFSSNKICECVEKYVPIVNPKKMKKSKWMNSDCMKSVKRKYKKWQTYAHTRNRRDFDIYCKARNDCTKTVRNAKRKFEKSIAENMTVNSKAFWGYIRDRSKSRGGISELKDSNGIIVDSVSNSGKANLLNEFFASVFVEEPTGLLPMFDTRYNDTPVSKLVEP